MPITLVTGLPGHGKTLYTLWRWRAELAKEAHRPVFHNNINGLAIEEWKPFDPEKWEDLPDGSVCIIDEAQRSFPVRGRDKPPSFIDNLAIHRHRGFDFVIITQNPMLIDSFVRRLVDRHFHVQRRFGFQYATVYEFVNGCNDNVHKVKKDGIRHEFKYPKQVFSWYKSAELHTVKRRMPARIWLLLSLPFVFAALVWVAWSGLSRWRKTEPEVSPAVVAVAPAVSPFAPGAVSPGGRPGQAVAGSRGPVMTTAEYLQAYQPRVPELPHTAPVYDKVTEPVRAPYPAGCMVGKSGCQCYTQQATKLTMSEDLCQRIAREGFFMAWAGEQGPQTAQSAGAGAVPQERSAATGARQL